MHTRLIGIYIPRLTPERLARHIEEDRWRFVNVGIPDLQRQGFALEWTREAIEDRSAEIAEEKADCLSRAALFEFEISGADKYFEPGVFESAWEPAFLAADGQSVIAEFVNELPEGEPFRLVFWIHDWDERSTLNGPEGPVQIGELDPVPERLWSLAPYAIVD